MGGFNLSAVNSNDSTGCGRSSVNIADATVKDYVPHHHFFNYWSSTPNPAHTRPASVSEIGSSGSPNHQYAQATQM
jgi:phospholipase C